MSSTKVKYVILILIAGLLSACAAPATQAPASQSTKEVVAATEAPTDIPVGTDTSVATVDNTPTSQPVAGANVSFANDILPIIESRCVNCHGGDRTEEGLILKTHSDIMAGSEN